MQLHSRLWLALALVFSFGACGKREPELPISLGFDWPLEGRVSVEEIAVKPAGSAKLRYELVWQADPEGDGFVLRYEDFRFEHFNGVSADDPRVREVVAAALPLVSAIPDLRVNAAGELIEFLGWEEAIEELIQHAAGVRAAKGNWTAEDEAEMRSVFQTPLFRRMINDKAAQVWEAWVGGWIDLSLTDSPTLSSDVMLQANGGLGFLPAHVEIRCTRTDQHHGVRCAWLEQTTTINLEADMIERLTGQFEAAGAKAFEEPPDRARTVGVVEGIWETHTLRPHQVRWAQRVTVEFDSQPPQTHALESHSPSYR